MEMKVSLAKNESPGKRRKARVVQIGLQAAFGKARNLPIMIVDCDGSDYCSDSDDSDSGNEPL